MIAVSQLLTFFKVPVLHLSIEHIFCDSWAMQEKKVGGQACAKPDTKTLSENFLFGLGTPDPYETSAVLSQGVQS